MIYSLTDIVRDVRVVIDENMTSGELLTEEDVETLSLEEIIRSKVEDGARMIEQSAPTELLEEGHTFGDAVYWEKSGSGRVMLPDDFMRLIAFRMSDWERTVYRAMSVNEASYGCRSSRYKGIRGNVQKPVCAIVNRPEGKMLEFYSCESEEAYVACGQYVPYPRIDENDGIDISERCYRGVVYMIGALVLTTLGEGEKAAAMSEMSKRMIEI